MKDDIKVEIILTDKISVKKIVIMEKSKFEELSKLSEQQLIAHIEHYVDWLKADSCKNIECESFRIL